MTDMETKGNTVIIHTEVQAVKITYPKGYKSSEGNYKREELGTTVIKGETHDIEYAAIIVRSLYPQATWYNCNQVHHDGRKEWLVSGSL